MWGMETAQLMVIFTLNCILALVLFNNKGSSQVLQGRLTGSFNRGKEQCQRHLACGPVLITLTILIRSLCIACLSFPSVALQD